MQRNIQVTTDVFALIWAARQPGENTEDQILRRILNAPAAESAKTFPGESVGYRDSRYGVEVPEGFTIFRNYNGADFTAKATSGSWLLTSTGDFYPSLNELSRAIGASENAWNGWRYKDETGVEKPLDGLRDKSKIRRRIRRSTLSLSDLDL